MRLADGSIFGSVLVMLYNIFNKNYFTLVHRVLCPPTFPPTHSLIDVDPCRESPYYLLADPMVEGGLYTGAFQVDADGQERLIEIARDVGTCSTCTGNGNLQQGFRAEVRGTVTALGDGSIPHTIAVTDAAPSNSMTTVCDGSGSSGGTGGLEDGDTTGETEEDDSDEESLDDGETSGLAEQSNSDDDNDTAIQVVAAISTACIVAVALLSMYGNAFQKDKTIQSGVVSLPQNAKLSAVDESTEDA